ncbi:MAG: c-type cytochrome [Verrucomicrobia bacterium]|nr:c-type cytochrome [Verrucomicrobiota bacterium]
MTARFTRLRTRFPAQSLLLLLCAIAGPSPETRGAEAVPFPKLFNTQEETIPLLKPTEALERIHLPPGFQATLFAGEPDVQQPIAMTTDSRGRLWVAENYTYSENAVNFHPGMRDRIVILEDTDHDGRFDKRTVFWDQAQKLTSIAVGFGGVFALCPPHLLFIPDRNHDDAPDGPPVPLLDGWNDNATRHTIANGLKWGPDGWLYGRQGIQMTSEVGAPGSPPNQRTRLNAAIWRFHPSTRQFEVVAQGTTNPWGHDWDDYGQLFFINTVIGHLWHAVPGAYFRRMYGEHFNPHLYELIEQTADHFHWDTREVWSEIRKLGVTPGTSQAGGGHAHCGFMIYLGDNWPASYRNTAFAVNYHGKRVNNDRLERRGAGYVGRHAPDLLTVDDPWFRGIDLLCGPDGGVYMSDWSDIGECHDHDGIHRTSGRVYKITYGKTAPPAFPDLAALETAQLVSLQTHANDWYVRQARLILQERATEGRPMAEAKAQLLRMFSEEADTRRKLRAIWALHAIGADDPAWLRRQLSHSEDHVRLWALRCLTDTQPPQGELLEALAGMARTETSGLVLAFLASTLQTVPPDQRWPLAEALSDHAELAQDATFPLLVWYGLQPAVYGNTAKALSLLRRTEIPKLRQFIARYLSEDWDQRPTEIRLLATYAADRKDLPFRLNILKGMAEALRGRRKAAAPEGWSRIVETLGSNGSDPLKQLITELSVVFGDGRASDELKTIVKNASGDLNARRRALESLAQSRVDGLAALAQPLLGEIEIAPDAIRTLAALGAPETPGLLIASYPNLRSPAAKTEAINALTSRATFARALLEAIDARKIGRKEVGAWSVRQLRNLGDPDLARRAAELWPEYRPISAEKQGALAQYRKRLTPEKLSAADRERGKALFLQSCGVCHKLFGNGSQVGPDLTGSDRRNLDYLLENILDPNAVVAESYRSSVITTKDDRVIQGIILSTTDRMVTVQTPTERLALERNQIESTRASVLSLMPEGLLEGLTESDQAHLIAYLMSP